MSDTNQRQKSQIANQVKSERASRLVYHGVAILIYNSRRAKVAIQHFGCSRHSVFHHHGIIPSGIERSFAPFGRCKILEDVQML